MTAYLKQHWPSILLNVLVGVTLFSVNQQGKDIATLQEGFRNLEYTVRNKLSESHSSLEKVQDRLVSLR